jgi:protein-tyrosine phosphatase
MAAEDRTANSHARVGARILVVCTANRGRSPLAAAMLGRKLAERGLRETVAVESAGLCVHELGRTSMPVPAEIAEVGARHGIDLRRHRARPLEWHRYEQFDLAIVMEGWQAEALASASRPAVPKAYTLRQLAGERGDHDTPDVAGRPVHELERFVAEAERCLDAAFQRGPLAELIARVASERVRG